MATQSSRPKVSSQPRSRTASTYDAQYGTTANRAKYQKRNKNAMRAYGAIAGGIYGVYGAAIYKGHRNNQRNAFGSGNQFKINRAMHRSSIKGVRAQRMKYQAFNKYYGARQSMKRPLMHADLLRMRMTSTKGMNRRMGRSIDVRDPASRRRSGRNQALAGVALIGIGGAATYAGVKMLRNQRKSAVPARVSQRSPRVRRDSKGRFAGSY